MNQTAALNLRMQKWVVVVSLLLFIIKLVAWFLTHSVAILTDALESIVNILAAFIGLFSLHVAARPRDEDHPYGHGKAEYISAGIEGVMIVLAGILIIYKAVQNYFYPALVHELDWGILLIVFTALVNYVLGAICERTGKKNNSMALTASGKHLKSDTMTTTGIVAGLILLYFTGAAWVDSAVALLFALIIIYTGFRILRSSAEGIMDKADQLLLKEVIAELELARRENWVDLHNLRILKYGNILHLDCHLTVPWYLNVHEAHTEIDHLSRIIKEKFGESVELFVHTDGCLDFSCGICTKENCDVRKNKFQKKIVWEMKNVLSNKKHGLGEGL
jgi:cation diffusion facilitator family transporter